MRTYLLSLFCILLHISAQAQDTIFFRSGSVVPAKILEVNETDVKYKKFTYQDGPTFIVSKTKIAKIRYADGSVETFSETTATVSAPKVDSGYGRNLLSIDPLALAFGNAALSYEHFGKRGRWSFRIPVSVAVFEGPNNRTGGGFDLKWYPNGQGKVRYYLGPSLTGYGDLNGHFIGGLLFINGVSFQPTKAFNITLDGGAGVGHLPVSRQKFIFVNGFIWRAGISVGIRM